MIHLPGLGVEARVDPGALEVLLAWEGAGPLSGIVAERARESGKDPDELAVTVARAMRALVSLGLAVDGEGHQ